MFAEVLDTPLRQSRTIFVMKLHHLSLIRLTNPFVPNAPFLYSLKTSENRKGFWYFQGVKKGVYWEQMGQGF